VLEREFSGAGTYFTAVARGGAAGWGIVAATDVARCTWVLGRGTVAGAVKAASGIGGGDVGERRWE
jgi:hypothetical protein